jgi:hypothetical protein
MVISKFGKGELIGTIAGSEDGPGAISHHSMPPVACR